MKQLWKRNAVVGTILVFVCAAIFLNGKYAEKVDKPTKVLGQSELVSTDGNAAEVFPPCVLHNKNIVVSWRSFRCRS